MRTLVVIAVLLVLVGWYLTFSATRLDRLHARLEGARSALDAQLVRRASVSLQIAVSGRLDPASGLLLADAAHEARDSGGADREQAESDLSRALHATFGERDSRPGPGRQPPEPDREQAGLSRLGPAQGDQRQRLGENSRAVLLVGE